MVSGASFMLLFLSTSGRSVVPCPWASTYLRY